ncbi:MAG: RnfABCDGE type electron transport complex subunit D [Candidatus Ratteibacteria bacterium]|nr:RnfABCDGE type electron transport complex subunit D [Candidatus Ratteibacteria bacterium]
MESIKNFFIKSLNEFRFKSIKTQLIIYLVCFAVFLAIKDQEPFFLSAGLIAVVSASVIETLLLYFKNKSLKITESSVISGLIVAYVISSYGDLWKIVFAAALAILSKHLIRFRQKHIFNPAAFGIFFAIILLGASTQWKGTYLWYILAPLGIYFTYKINKLEVITGYAVISLILFGTQAFMQKVPLWNIWGYFSYFYVFVMVIEPKTTPVKPIGKYIFGAGIAVLIFILTEIGIKFDVELLSLLVMNTTIPLSKLLFKKQAI